MVEESRQLFPNLFRRLMVAYEGSDDILAYQARFILYFSLACTAVLLVTFLNSILVQLIDPAQQALNLPLLLVELSGLVCFCIVLVLLTKGHAILAAHLLIFAGLSATWIVMFIDRGTAIGRLDSIVFVFAILSITPLMVRRRSSLIFVYTLVNIPILWLFLFSQRDGLGIGSSAFFDYLGDVTVTLLFVSVACSTVFAMNRQAQDRLRQDIRKREEAETALRQSKAQVTELLQFQNQMLDTAVLWISTLDRDGNVATWNNAAERISGYSKEEVIGHDRIWEWLYPDEAYRAVIAAKGAAVIREGSRVENLETTITCKTGETRTIVWHANSFSDDRGEIAGSIALGADITEQNRMQEQLQRAQKMEAIGTLAGGIAHDFNNILSGMIGYTELALNDVEDRLLAKEKLERVLAAGSRATELVKQILTFSRSHKSEVKPICPARIVKEVIKLMRASLPSTIGITQSINSENYVLADATNIHQVLMNLCTNAAHAMKQKGGVLSISLQDVTLGCDDLSHRPDTLPGAYLKISVEDTGTGMTKAVQEKAFDPFFTTKESGEGTGMGLSAVHGIIAKLGGFISLDSEPGQGTAIHVHIPVIPKPSEIEEKPAAGPLKGGTERILFVDDEQLQIDLAKDALTFYGYQVTAFSDSTIALAHFQQEPDAYDLVITDMTMPKMTGDILTQKIHLKRPDMPVIMFTGFSEVMDEDKAKALGIHAFLYKPVLMETMIEAIRKVMAA